MLFSMILCTYLSFSNLLINSPRQFFESNIKPLFLLQKRAIRIITFASFIEHSSPIFKSLKIIKFLDLVRFITAVFMSEFHKQLLQGPKIWNSIDESLKSTSFAVFKKKLKNLFIDKN